MIANSILKTLIFCTILSSKCIQRLKKAQCIHAMRHMPASTLISKFKQNKYAMGRKQNLSITFCIILDENFTTPCEPCKCVISLLQTAIGNIFKPIGMLYNAVSVQRQNTLIP